MAGIPLLSGFDIKSTSPVDARLVMTKNEMLAAKATQFPEKYFAVCKDDGAIYIYNSENEPDEETGKFRKFEGGDSSKELTKAEYDALSEAEKNNGTTYYVKDEDGGSEASPAVKSCKKFSRAEVRFHDVAHRGSYFAPENTIPAWILAKDIGYNAVETDVAFTSDNIPVCIHDKTIDRTSNGSGTVSEMTLEQLRLYSYDNNFTALSNKEIIFKNPDIPTFDDYILTCKTYGLHAYIHVHPFHTYTKERIANMMEIVEKYSMKDCVTWVTSIFEWLGWIKDIDPTARLGYICDNLSESNIVEIKKLLTGVNEVFIDFDVTAGTLTDEIVNLCQLNNLPLELQIQNESAVAQSVCDTYPYITGCTSNRFMISQYLAQGRGGKGSFSSGTDASNPSVSITVNTDVASSGSARATRIDNIVSLKLTFVTATSPSSSTRTLFTDLAVRYRPRYNQVVVAMGYLGDDVYFARLRIHGYFEGTPGAISVLETNAPVGTTFETTFTYLI